MSDYNLTKRWLSFVLLSLLFACPGFAKTFLGASGLYHVSFTVKPFPVIVGDEHAQVDLKDSNGKPVTGAQLQVQTDMAGMPMGVRPFPLTETSPGHYEGVFTLSMQGLWSIFVRVNGSLGEEKVEFQMQTGKGGLPHWLFWGLIVLGGVPLIWLMIRYSEILLSQKTFVSLIILVGFSAITFFVAKIFLKKPDMNVMGMKMNMNAPNMGMSMRLLSAAKPVATEKVASRTIESKVTYTGTVAPDLEEEVYPRVIGWLSKMSLYPGDHVKKGEEIARLDRGEITGEDREVHAHAGMETGPHDVVVSRLSLQASHDKENEASEELRKAQSNLTYWQKEFPREEFLLKEGAISKEEYDKEKAEFESALAEVRAKESARRAAFVETDITSHALMTIEDYRVLRAHISGIVTDRMVNEGVLVQPGIPILKIADIRHIRIQANVAEQDLADIMRGSLVYIRSSKLSGKILTARVTSIFHSVNSETHTGKVEAYILNPEEKLFPGDFVDVDFVTQERKNVLTIPSSALIEERDGTYVWIVKDGLAGSVKIVPGITDGEKTEIRSGLQVGDEVIYTGQEGLVPDQPVKASNFGSGPYKEILLPNGTEEQP